MPSTKLPQIDESTLLNAVLSGGVIGGAVGLIDKGFGRAKYAVPLGIALGIFLDYNLKKLQVGEHLEVAKAYFTKLWEKVHIAMEEKEVQIRLDIVNALSALGDATEERIEEEVNKAKQQYPRWSFPEMDDWGGITNGIAAIAGLLLLTYGLSAGIGHYTTAAIPAQLFLRDRRADALDRAARGLIPPLEELISPPSSAGDMPPSERLDIYAGGNPVNIILAPTMLQLLGAFNGGRNRARNAGAGIAIAIIRETVRASGLERKIMDMIEQGIRDGTAAIMPAFKSALDVFKDKLVDAVTLRQEDMYLTDERLLLMQNPDGSQAYALLENGNGQVEAIPSVRLPFPR